MKKSRSLSYFFALLATCVLVAASVFAPSALLHRKENALLGGVTYVTYGDYSKHAPALATDTPKPSASPLPTPAPEEDATADIMKKMSILEQTGLTKIKIPSSGDMDMRTAVDMCIRQIEEYIKAGAVPPLANFPGGYKVQAELQTAAVMESGDSFDYWSITFSSESKQKRTNGSIHVTADAQNGTIYGIKMSTAVVVKDFNLSDSAKYIAHSMRVNGVVKLLSEQEAVWISNNRTLYIGFNYSAYSTASSFAMWITTRAP